MIRFCDLGDQIYCDGESRSFAFNDTTTDSFINLNGSETFDSWQVFEDCWKAEYIDRDPGTYTLDRFRNLCPQWVFQDLCRIPRQNPH